MRRYCASGLVTESEQELPEWLPAGLGGVDAFISCGFVESAGRPMPQPSNLGHGHPAPANTCLSKRPEPAGSTVQPKFRSRQLGSARVSPRTVHLQINGLGETSKPACGTHALPFFTSSVHPTEDAPSLGGVFANPLTTKGFPSRIRPAAATQLR